MHEIPTIILFNLKNHNQKISQYIFFSNNLLKMILISLSFWKTISGKFKEPALQFPDIFSSR